MSLPRSHVAQTCFCVIDKSDMGYGNSKIERNVITEVMPFHPHRRNLPSILAALTTTAFAALAGCAGDPAVGNCTTQHAVTAGESKGDASYTLTTSAPSLSLYPGQTVTVPVTVQPVGTATGSVTLQVSGMPSGVSVAPVTAAVGATANLQFVSTVALGAECFNGSTQYYTAFSTLAVQGSGSAGSKTLGLDLDMALENPAYAPAKTDLPTLAISTTGAAAIVSKDDYLTGSVTLVDPSNKKNNYTGTMQIKGHGNTTWVMPKKPYRLKLDSKSGLLGMPSEKNWILLANYDDKTMLRDAIASQLSDISGLPWAPHSKFVEVTLNGAYQGTYQLIENIDVNSNRINITDPGTSTTDATADGFLLEIDQREGDTYHWITPHGIDIGVDDPDPPPTSLEPYIHDRLNTAEAAFFSSDQSTTNGWRAKWNESSLVDWYIVNELMGNQDAIAYSSDYLYKDAGDVPFVMGPVWDFDISSGNDNYGLIEDPTVPWLSTGHPWYAQLFRDPEFVAAVKARWKIIRPQIDTLPAYIDTNAATLQLAAANNYNRWPTLYQRVWPNPEAAGSYNGEVTILKTWLAARVAYMDRLYLN